MCNLIISNKIRLYVPILIIFYAIFFFNTKQIFAQEKKILIGIHFSPLLSYTYDVQDAYIPSQDFFSLKPKINFSTGIVLNYYPHNNIGIKSGISITRKSYTILLNRFANDSIAGFIKHIPIIHAIEIPLLLILRSNLLKNGYYLKGFAGVSFDWNNLDAYKLQIAGSGLIPTEMLDSGAVYFFGTIFSPSIVLGSSIKIKEYFEIGLSWHYGLRTMHAIKTKSYVNKQVYESLVIPKISYISLNITYYPDQNISFKKPLLYLLLAESIIFSSILF